MTADAKLDLIWGAAAIGKVLNLTLRQTFQKLENGALPGKKVGGTWVCDRSQLCEFFLGDGR